MNTLKGRNVSTRKTLLTWIEDIQEGISYFQQDADMLLHEMKPEEYAVDGEAIRIMQMRLGRIRGELDTLYRRLDDFRGDKK